MIINILLLFLLLPFIIIIQTIKDISNWIYTYYNYDASGNVMSVYTRTAASIGGGSTYSDVLSLQEQHIYGSGRLGLKRPEDVIEWTGTYTMCASPTVECRTYTGSAVVPVASFTATQRNLGYKEFELDNHLGNVIATVSDRKIQYVSCKTFTGTPIGPTDPIDNNNFRTFGAVNSNTTVFGTTAGSDSLEVQPTARYGGINASFSAAITGSAYTMAFDVNIGTTLTTDSLYAKMYGFSSAMGPGSDSSYVLITSSGHYQLTYTAEPSTLNFKMYYNAPGTSSSTARAFYVQNLYISDAIPLNPPSPPTASVNILATCNHFAGANFIHYFPDLLMHTDYYAFGQEMPGRTWQGTSDNYRFDFNKKEDDKTSGWYTQDYGFRTYDYRLARFFSQDPLFRKYPELTPYQFGSNNPILNIDLDGLEGVPAYSDPLTPVFEGFGEMMGTIANWIDSWAVGDKEDMTQEIKSTQISSNTKRTTSTFATTTTEASTNLKGNFDYIKYHNSNEGNPNDVIKVTNESEAGVEEKTETKTGNTKVTNTKRINTEGQVSEESKIDVNITVRKVPVNISGSEKKTETKSSTKISIGTQKLGSDNSSTEFKATGEVDSKGEVKVGVSNSTKQGKTTIKSDVYIKKK